MPTGRWSPLIAPIGIVRLADEMAALDFARKQREALVSEWRIAANVLSTARFRKRLGSTKVERDERDRLIIALCETHKLSDVARLTGFSRQRIYQILGGKP